MSDRFVKGFAAMVEDIRRTVVETGWFGHPVTLSSVADVSDSPGETSPGEQLGWLRRKAPDREAQTFQNDVEVAAKETKAERGIDL